MSIERISPIYQSKSLYPENGSEPRFQGDQKQPKKQENKPKEIFENLLNKEIGNRIDIKI